MQTNYGSRTDVVCVLVKIRTNFRVGCGEGADDILREGFERCTQEAELNKHRVTSEGEGAVFEISRYYDLLYTTISWVDSSNFQALITPSKDNIILYHNSIIYTLSLSLFDLK